jgi:hypothetical protein
MRTRCASDECANPSYFYLRRPPSVAIYFYLRPLSQRRHNQHINRKWLLVISGGVELWIDLAAVNYAAGASKLV